MNTVLLHKDITGEVIKAAYEVHNTLGCGLLEKVYENSLEWELLKSGKDVTTQEEFRVIYKDKEVGLYYADLLIDGKVIVEIKTVERIDNVHRAQLINYLKISGCKVGLIINFAKPKLEYERFVN